MIPWHVGRHLVWDVMVVDTLAPSYIQASSTMAGSAAEIATERKNSKYSELLNTLFRTPSSWNLRTYQHSWSELSVRARP